MISTKKIVMINDSQEPSIIFFIESGWVDWYHMIYEDPQDGDLSYEHRFVYYTDVPEYVIEKFKEEEPCL